MESVKQYFENTKTLLYSFLFSLPLFLIYEGLIIISQPSAEQIVRISVDVWIKSIFTSLGVNAVSFSLLVVLLAGFIILYKERERLRTLNFKYFPALLAESLIYGIIVAFISSTLTSLLLNLSASNPVEELSYLQKLALSLGAGLYEELFFRVILVSLFILIFNKLFNNKKWASVTAAVVLSALLFSAVHYTGSMGDFFTLNSFFYRFLFGLILNGIYVARGFGVAAWTHALYDVLVITFF
ncbi:MAG: CPBP family intramembrane metalloprotease [Balneolaceae bacterium]|nr:CPBP family intramembrane metalloprotease [Balneolaceae bacterium]